jgi:peptidoglycan/xylan/chitin deacetylase (PgdA/CDA1 family)
MADGQGRHEGHGLRARCAQVRAAAAPTLKTALLRAGVLRALRTIHADGRVAILRYHAICGSWGYDYASPGICISPEAFEQHVAYLATRYRVISLPDAVRVLKRGGSLPSHAVAITFDDGYADNLAAACVLHRYGLTATFYITAGCMAGGEPFWPSEIRVLVARLGARVATVRMGAQEIALSCATPAEREASIRRLTKAFKSHPVPVRERARAELRDLVGGGPVPSPMLTWDEVRVMHGLGMTIGAHTMTHPNLPSAGLQAATREIVDCRRRLEAEVGAPVTMFSYPNGGAERYYTPELMRAVADAGFEAAATSRSGFAGRHSDFYALDRVQVAERLEDLVFSLDAERLMVGGQAA